MAFCADHESGLNPTSTISCSDNCASWTISQVDPDATLSFSTPFGDGAGGGVECTDNCTIHQSDFNDWNFTMDALVGGNYDCVESNTTESVICPGVTELIIGARILATNASEDYNSTIVDTLGWGYHYFCYEAEGGFATAPNCTTALSVLGSHNFGTNVVVDNFVCDDSEHTLVEVTVTFDGVGCSDLDTTERTQIRTAVAAALGITVDDIVIASCADVRRRRLTGATFVFEITVPDADAVTLSTAVAASNFVDTINTALLLAGITTYEITSLSSGGVTVTATPETTMPATTQSPNTTMGGDDSDDSFTVSMLMGALVVMYILF